MLLLLWWLTVIRACGRDYSRARVAVIVLTTTRVVERRHVRADVTGTRLAQCRLLMLLVMVWLLILTELLTLLTGRRRVVVVVAVRVVASSCGRATRNRVARLVSRSAVASLGRRWCRCKVCHLRRRRGRIRGQTMVVVDGR